MQSSPPGASLTCPTCSILQAQNARLLDELHQARLMVAEGPRARVLELERNLSRANAVTAVLRGFIPRQKNREVEAAIKRELGVIAAAVYERTQR